VDIPYHLAVDGNGFVYAVDLGNSQVVLLSPELTYVRDVALRAQLEWHSVGWGPVRLFLDADKGRLYVAESEWKDGEFKTGRVTVVSF